MIWLYCTKCSCNLCTGDSVGPNLPARNLSGVREQPGRGRAWGWYIQDRPTSQLYGHR